MDVLFVIGRGSRHENCELRWALRSLETHGKNLGRVSVVGYPPTWLNPETVNLLSVPDMKQAMNKHDNILSCILTAIHRNMVSGEFLYSSDDHFLIKDVDLDNYPYWYVREETPIVNEDDKSINNWHRSCSDTRKLLEGEGMSIKWFNCHMDTHMHTADAPRVEELIEKGRKLGFKHSFEPTCLFMAARVAREDIKLTKVHDNKMTSFTGAGSLEHTITGRDTFSIGDDMFNNPEFEHVVNLMYRQKSRFEL